MNPPCSTTPEIFYGVPSNEVCLQTCSGLPCNDPTISGWIFTDEGFIDGGQGGAFRVYSSPASVPASPWSFQSANQHSLRMSFEDDGNCANFNHNNQIGTAEATVTVSCATRVTVTWSGKGEQKDPSPQNPDTFERMNLFLDNGLVGSAHSPGGGLECEAPVANVVSEPPPPQIIIIQPGTHALKITTETHDALYHIGAFYQFLLDFEPL